LRVKTAHSQKEGIRAWGGGNAEKVGSKGYFNEGLTCGLSSGESGWEKGGGGAAFGGVRGGGGRRLGWGGACDRCTGFRGGGGLCAFEKRGGGVLGLKGGGGLSAQANGGGGVVDLGGVVAGSSGGGRAWAGAQKLWWGCVGGWGGGISGGSR